MAKDICSLLKGDVVVTPATGDPVVFRTGDLVTFPSGMSWTWTIHSAVRKHGRLS